MHYTAPQPKSQAYWRGCAISIESYFSKKLRLNSVAIKCELDCSVFVKIQYCRCKRNIVMMDEAARGQCAFDLKRDNWLKNTLWLLLSPESPTARSLMQKENINICFILTYEIIYPHALAAAGWRPIGPLDWNDSLEAGGRGWLKIQYSRFEKIHGFFYFAMFSMNWAIAGSA